MINKQNSKAEPVNNIFFNLLKLSIYDSQKYNSFLNIKKTHNTQKYFVNISKERNLASFANFKLNLK